MEARSSDLNSSGQPRDNSVKSKHALSRSHVPSSSGRTFAVASISPCDSARCCIRLTRCHGLRRPCDLCLDVTLSVHPDSSEPDLPIVTSGDFRSGTDNGTCLDPCCARLFRLLIRIALRSHCSTVTLMPGSVGSSRPLTQDLPMAEHCRSSDLALPSCAERHLYISAPISTNFSPVPHGSHD